jgi:hypothetical protein
MNRFKRALSHWRKRRQWLRDACPRSHKAAPIVVSGFQGRRVCPGCNRAIVVNQAGTFAPHKRKVKNTDYLTPKWKGFTT